MGGTRQIVDEEKANLALFETKEAKGKLAFRLFSTSVFLGICLIWAYRLTNIPSASERGRWVWIGMFIAELGFGFYWILTQAIRLNVVRYYPLKLNLAQSYYDKLPRVDIFVCTADPTLEPPTLVVNTILSVMSLNYPTEKLSVYLSDDGGSQLTFYALLEASRFSKHWIPFCKKLNIEPRSPAAYFTRNFDMHEHTANAEQWLLIKKQYEDMVKRIEAVINKGSVPEELKNQHQGFSEWNSNVTKQNHQPIVQIVIDGRDTNAVGGDGCRLPTLVYMAREKRPNCPHHFKAGAMNAPIRVSSEISNGAIILNLDCDMYANNADSIKEALCFFMDEKRGHQIAYVQHPQEYSNITENDLYGNSSPALHKVELPGVGGFGAALYCGTGCFHRRESLCGSKYSISKEYKGLWNSETESRTNDNRTVNELEEASKVLASCGYEKGTRWGTEMGLIYGCPVEDIVTGLTIHCRGWKSVYYNPDNRGFEGVAPPTLDIALVQFTRWADGMFQIFLSKYCPIRVSEDVKKYALLKGFEIYEKMCLDNVPMNEATLTAVARMAMSMGNGDMAFDMVKQMKLLGINPRLRSYGPALSVFCTTGEVDKAFHVEKHMLEHGVEPEEPELEALLRVSIGAGKSDKVYYLLHKLRTSVRKVSPSTADLIVKWFVSKAASRVGKRTMDQRLIKEAIENGGGGWHGQGWLGKGRWKVSRTAVGADALCKCCGERLALIDLDPVETEKFAESVASIAIKREKNFSFQKFQKWLDYYGPFEAVVDAANIGLFSQKRFMPSKVNAVVNTIRQKLPSKRWPLIVLHNKRITGRKMDEPGNKTLIEKWKNADALYATPTGSNDDWYWLYAAIKFKCLIVTNDEMRDHTFQLLGNDFFPKWKERHQVHFSFSNAGPVFYMPPPCSVVIQESEKGHWHIPIASALDYDSERTWLCITRANSHLVKEDSATINEGFSCVKSSQPLHHSKEFAKSTTQTQTKVNSNSLPLNDGNNDKPQKPTKEIYKNIRDISLASVSSDQYTILSEIEAAEMLGNRVIDFQI